jgi:hypothetical protein
MYMAVKKLYKDLHSHCLYVYEPKQNKIALFFEQLLIPLPNKIFIYIHYN